MLQNQQTIKKAWNYLLSLGYSESQMTTDVSSERGTVDLVVYENSLPWIAIEVKSNIKISRSDIQKLKYDPHVRQLQSHALTLNAPYYLLTDGDMYWWFETDKSGRPQLLDNPVQPTSKEYIQTPRRDRIVNVLRELKFVLFERQQSISADYEASVILFAKLLGEQGDNVLRNNLQRSSNELLQDYVFNSIKIETANDINATEDALKILDQLAFRDANPTDVLGAIDEVFLGVRLRKEFRIPRWLADFLCRLSNLSERSRVLDISCGYGDIVAAAMLATANRHPLSIRGISYSRDAALWAMIQLIVSKGDPRNIIIEDRSQYNREQLFEHRGITNVITAPPFGNIGNNFHLSERAGSGLTRLEDIYLDLAVQLTADNGRIVMVVPESLLFEGGKRKRLRESMFDRMRISAVIGMPNGALQPSSNIRSSIIVIDKKEPVSRQDIFMAVIEAVPSKDTFVSQDIPEVANILREFEKWNNNQAVSSESKNIWAIQNNQLDINNWTAASYLASKFNKSNRELLPYASIQLRNIAKLSRGRAIKLDDSGTMPVVGPAAIRPLEIERSSIRRARQESLPENAVKLRSGDLVMNNISTYLGASAIVPGELDGFLVSQHAFVIKPDKKQIIPEYLAIALNSDYVKSQISTKATGAVMPALNISTLASIEIPVPSLSIQERIIKEVNKWYAEANRLRSELEATEKKLRAAIDTLAVSEEIE